MEHFDDLLKTKMEGQTHRFRFSDWKSFCAKAGINPLFISLKMGVVASVSAIAVVSIVASAFYFTHQSQPVSMSAPEDSFQTE